MTFIHVKLNLVVAKLKLVFADMNLKKTTTMKKGAMLENRETPKQNQICSRRQGRAPAYISGDSNTKHVIQ